MQYLSGLFLLLLRFLLPASMNLCVSNAIPQWPFFATFGTSSYLPLWISVSQIKYLNGLFLLLVALPLNCLYDSLCLKCNTSLAVFWYFWNFLLPASINLCVSNTIPQWPFFATFALPPTCLYESLCLKCNTSVTFFCYFWHFLLPASMNLCVSNKIPQWPFFATCGTSS
jgi:hypothetical protein